MASLSERYVASMVLSGAGDAIGFRNGRWEFCNSGKTIHKELKDLGGVEKLNVSLPEWKISDDTVMHLATARALIEKSGSADKEALYLSLAKYYQLSMNDMSGRSAGITCSMSCARLQPDRKGGYQIPFNSRGGGCGAAMRSMCIGLRYPSDADLDDLIAVSVEAGRMTHHHPTGYLGSLAGALFVKYALQNKPVNGWGAGLMSVLPKALNYMKSKNRYVEENTNAWNYFEAHWKDYLKQRGILDGTSDPKFPEKYGVEERDLFYKSLSYSGWGGASGHDAPMIAYDALLCAGDNWETLVKHGMLHSGDSDSTGVIAAACFGAMYGFKNVPQKNYINLEYRDKLMKCGEKLFRLSHPDQDFCPADADSTSQARGSDGQQNTDTATEEKNSSSSKNKDLKDEETESNDVEMKEEDKPSKGQEVQGGNSAGDDGKIQEEVKENIEMKEEEQIGSKEEDAVTTVGSESTDNGSSESNKPQESIVTDNKQPQQTQ